VKVLTKLEILFISDKETDLPVAINRTLAFVSSTIKASDDGGVYINM